MRGVDLDRLRAHALAMWRSASGGIALSAVATTDHDGSDFQAAASARSSKIAANGTLADRQDPDDVLRQIGRERLPVELRRDRQLDGGLAVGERVVARPHRPDQRRLSELAEDLAERLTLVERERRDVDEADRVGRARAGDGDHRAAVGVADQQHRPVDLVDVARDVLGVVGQAPQGVRRREHRHVVGLQVLDDRGPVRGVGEAAVHEDDGRGVG